MLVGERMSHPAITIQPDWSINKALNLMRQENIHRLPVIDDQGMLVGIVSEGDLLRTAPPDAAQLSLLERDFIYEKLTVARIMTRKILTVSLDASIEEAARMMVDHNIGGMPVVGTDPQVVVGIITESDIFKIFLELLGARQSGIRVTALVPDVRGELAQLTKAIFDAGGNIIALGTFPGESLKNRQVTIKVTSIDTQTLQDALQPFIERILDIREAQVRGS
jgi:acetoin utilization protein AcuB